MYRRNKVKIKTIKKSRKKEEIKKTKEGLK